MAGTSNIDVRVENLLVRFTPTPRVDLEEAIERLGGIANRMSLSKCSINLGRH